MTVPQPEVLYAWDMDRTLVDTELVVAELVSLSRELASIDENILRAAQERIQASGGSFDVLSWLQDQEVSPKKINAIYQAFGENEEGVNYLYPDAHVVLGHMDTTAAPHIIPTYGSTDWQETKLQATGLARRPYLITPVKYKGELIAEWRDVGGGYSVTAKAGQFLTAQTVSLTDDKADAFRGLPLDCRGYKLERPDEPVLASQAGDIPSNVMICSSLLSIVPDIIAATL